MADPAQQRSETRALGQDGVDNPENQQLHADNAAERDPTCQASACAPEWLAKEHR